MEQKALVFYTKPWQMTDERTGELRVGITIEYIMAEHMKPVSNEDGSQGYGYCKESLATDKLPKIKEVPGYYNLKFVLKTGSKGKPVIKLDDIEFLSSVEVVKR